MAGNAVWDLDAHLVTIDLKEIVLSILSFLGVLAVGLIAFFGKRALRQIEETAEDQDKRLRDIEVHYVGRTELTGAINRVTDSIEAHNDKMEGNIKAIKEEFRGDFKDMSKTISGLTAAIIKKGNRDD